MSENSATEEARMAEQLAELGSNVRNLLLCYKNGASAAELIDAMPSSFLVFVLAFERLRATVPQA